MSETPKQYESIPDLTLFQVVLVPLIKGEYKRCVVVDTMPDAPDFLGTCEIINEGTEAERLGLAGTARLQDIVPTAEQWTKSRTVDGMAATFGITDEEMRQKVSDLFPDIEQ